MKDARTFTNYKQTLARHRMLLLATVGSHMLGMNSAESDIDEMGICLEKPKQLLGFAPFEDDSYRTAEDRTGRVGAKSEAGDLDLSIYGLRKFVRMCLTGNPNVITLLYLPDNHFSIYTSLGSELRALADDFASKDVVKAFLGYLRAQTNRLQGTQGQMRVNREDLLGEHGYDIKYAAHALRLGMQGYQFVRHGKLSFPLSQDEMMLLRKIRKGSMGYSDAIDHIRSYESSIQDRLRDSDLPDKPNYDKIENWLISVYEREWYANKAASQQQGAEANKAWEDPRASKKDRETIESEIPF